MSLIKSIRNQLGLSVTPANNFTLDASADNGTMKLARGNAGATTQDIMTVDDTGVVAFPQNARSWTIVTGFRGFGVDYTNVQKGSISVSVICGSTSGTGSVALLVNGITVTKGYAVAGSTEVTIVAEVPLGAVYRLNNINNGSIVQWAELA